MIKLTKEKIAQILFERFNGEFKKLSDIPSPTLFKDGVKGAKRVVKAINQKEKIVIVGDYDVDGIVSTTIISEFFEQINYPVDVIIPNRFTDGYGISTKIIDRVDANLIITVDNGISAIDAALLAKQKGIDLIITDHHTVGQTIPDAYAIINPKQHDCNFSFKEICGAQVAWLFCALIKQELKIDINMSYWLDILSIAIIADVMPLQNINRVMVQAGLKAIQKSKRPSSTIITEFFNKSSISSEDIAFQISPRINSAGRLEDGIIALNFLKAKNTQIAYEQFEKLTLLNTQRKQEELIVFEDAQTQVNENDKIIVVANEGWNEGVVGIVASRLVQKFQKPAFVLSIHNNIAKGSGRSLADVNLYSLLAQSDQFLNGYGGHKLAAGLSLNIENIENFRKKINSVANNLKDEQFIPKDTIFGKLDLNDIDNELIQILDAYEPYGEANNRPLFFIENAYIHNINRMGQNKEHAKILIKSKSTQSNYYPLLAFGYTNIEYKNNNINCSATINKNEFMGKTTIQLLLDKLF